MHRARCPSMELVVLCTKYIHAKHTLCPSQHLAGQLQLNTNALLCHHYTVTVVFGIICPKPIGACSSLSHAQGCSCTTTLSDSQCPLAIYSRGLKLVQRCIKLEMSCFGALPSAVQITGWPCYIVLCVH